MRLGSILSVSLGVLFTLVLSSILRDFDFKKESKISGVPLRDIYLSHTPALKLRVLNLFSITKVVYSKPVLIIKKILKFILLALILTGVVLLVVINFTDYGAYLQMEV